MALALFVIAVTSLVLNQSVRRMPSGGTADGQPGAEAPVAAAVPVPKKDLKWNSGESRFYQGESPFTGVAVDQHKNGQPRLRWELKEGKMHGLVLEYNEQGTLVTSKLYAAGLRHGETRYFWPEGQIMKIVQYVDDVEQPGEQLFNKDGTPMSKEPNSASPTQPK